jgi:hypothetical protein
MVKDFYKRRIEGVCLKSTISEINIFVNYSGEHCGPWALGVANVTSISKLLGLVLISSYIHYQYVYFISVVYFLSVVYILAEHIYSKIKVLPG